jgi:AcrR family transcriptional regulator
MKRKAASPANRKAGRSTALDEAGGRLLSRHDYDLVSVARIAKEAGCSVGAFYGRYRNKEAYLHSLIISAFRNLTQCAQEDLGETSGRKPSAKSIAGLIVDHVVARMTAPRAAGVIRATMKLATFDPAAIEPFEDYRESVAERAIALLAQTSNKSTPRQIRAALQIVIATVTDAILQKKPGPLVVGSPGLNEALRTVLAGCLGLGPGVRWTADEQSTDKPVTAKDEPSTLPQGHLALYDPDMRTFQGTRPKKAGTENATVKRGSHLKAQLKRSAGRNSKKAESNSSKSAMVKPPRVPASAVNYASNLRKKPRPRIV